MRRAESLHLFGIFLQKNVSTASRAGHNRRSKREIKIMENETDEEKQFEVVVNNEEQYSIWPKGRPLPSGWQTIGKSSSKKECLDYIGAVWTDMRPKSLRVRMEEKNR